MDEVRFDSWSKSLAGTVNSRRALVRHVLASVTGAVLAALGSGASHAKKKKKRKKKRKTSTAVPQPPTPVPCVPQCAEKTCGPNGCGGSCGSCSPNAPTCVNGECKAGVCPPNVEYCGPTFVECGPGTCGCGAHLDGSGFCTDCAICLTPECTKDDDCKAAGLPDGTICGVGTGSKCSPCAKVCLTPCNTCQSCECFP
jgi:hypothetical protein